MLVDGNRSGAAPDGAAHSHKGTENMGKNITDEQFDAKLAEIINRHPASNLLSIPGVYEALSEEFNNEILDELGFED